MKTILTLIVLSISTVLCSAGEQGIFVSKPKSKATVEYIDGQVVTKVPARRVQIFKTALRSDTQDNKKYWVELYMKERLDPGDWYSCLIGGKEYLNLKYRGGGDSYMWVRSFTDVKNARKFVDGVAKAYKIVA